MPGSAHFLMQHAHFKSQRFHHGHAVGDGHGTAADENDLTLAARAEPASHEPGLEPLQILP
jgi:hypothetical protein